MATTKARRVGGDWVETVDPVSNRVYYANMVTRETSWVMPEEVKRTQEQKAGVQQPQAAKPAASSGGGGGGGKPAEDAWVERIDPASGRMYYYNKARKETSWTKPDDSVDAAGADPDRGKGAWVPRIDPRTNRTYFYNPITQKTSWDNPDEKEKEKPRRSTVAKPGLGSRLSKRISKKVEVDDQPAFENPSMVIPTNRTSARMSIRLGAMPGPNKAGNRMSIADVARLKKAEKSGEEEHAAPAETPSLGDRFAKLRALRDRADPKAAEEEEVVERQFDLEDLTHQAMAEITYDLEFRSYAEEFLNLKKKGFMSSKALSVDELIAWQADKLKAPMHALSDPALAHDAVLAFSNIQHYMGDKPTKSPMKNADKVFKITVQCPEELRDEVYTQLIKQTTNNPDASSCLKGWQMLAMCAGLFPPSFKLEKYLLSYFKRGSDNEPYPGVAKYAEYALLRVQRTMDLGARLEAPTELEVLSTQEINPVPLTINMLDGSSRKLEAECWTTVADMCAQMAKALKIKDATPFGLFEINQDDEERALENDNRILDVVAYWDREKRMAKSKKNAPSFQFVYKVKLFFDIKEDDSAAVNVAFHQAVHDVTDSRYPCSEEDAFRLAALQAQERFGDCDGSDPFGDELQAFLPANFYHEDVESEIKKEIMGTYALLKGYDRMEAMNNYLDYVKAWKIYGSAYFFVEPENNKTELPGTVVLAVNASGVLIVDPTTKEFLAEYPYSEIVTWGHSSVCMILVCGNLIRQNKLYFKTDQGAEINTLVHAYVQRLVEE